MNRTLTGVKDIYSAAREIKFLLDTLRWEEPVDGPTNRVHLRDMHRLSEDIITLSAGVDLRPLPHTPIIYIEKT